MPSTRMLPAALLAALTLAVGGCASSGQPSRPAAAASPSLTPSATPSPTPAPVGHDLALSDLPDGWADMPRTGWLRPGLAECAGLTEGVAASRSPLLLTGGGRSRRLLDSEVATVASPTAATRDLHAFGAHLDCARHLPDPEADADYSIGPVRVAALSDSAVGPQAAGFRIRTTENYKGLTTDLEYTVTLVINGDREALMFTLAASGTFDPALHASMLRILRGRMASTSA